MFTIPLRKGPSYAAGFHCVQEWVSKRAPKRATLSRTRYFTTWLQKWLWYKHNLDYCRIERIIDSPGQSLLDDRLNVPFKSLPCLALFPMWFFRPSDCFVSNKFKINVCRNPNQSNQSSSFTVFSFQIFRALITKQHIKFRSTSSDNKMMKWVHYPFHVYFMYPAKFAEP